MDKKALQHEFEGTRKSLETLRYAATVLLGLSIMALALDIYAQGSPAVRRNPWDPRPPCYVPSRDRCRAICARTCAGAVPPSPLRASSEPRNVSTA